jgi:hypothetical protein
VSAINTDSVVVGKFETQREAIGALEETASMTDQPFIDSWPSWDEPLSKVTAPLDIAAARWKLAQRFNSRLPKIPPAIREQQIDAAWQRHRNGGRP